jgi:serine protease AprX
MAIKIPRALIEYILLGSGDSRRYIQDSPILIDVWVKYAEQPGDPADLLITSHKDTTANELAAEIYKAVSRPAKAEDDPAVSPLQGFVAARLYFGEVLAILVPLTDWWRDPKTKVEFAEYDSAGSPKLKQTVDYVIKLLKQWLESAHPATTANTQSALERFVALCTLVGVAAFDDLLGKDRSRDDTADRLKQLSADDIVPTVLGFLQTMQEKPKSMVWQISLNRPAATAIAHSVPTVKADAARRLFNIDCSGINWAVIDTGIDAQHPAFGDRIKRTFDFTGLRYILSVGNERPAVREMNRQRIEEARGEKLPRSADTKLKEIGQALHAGRPAPWDLVTELVELTKPPPPVSQHGTHVAGIIGAAKIAEPDSADGMCPTIGIWDFRVLKSDIVKKSEFENTEFAIVAALQFIRNINEQSGGLLVKGVNMSLQITHDVKGAACGRTPVCKESERLIDSGVVVVAAAGNHGYQETIIEGQTVNDYVAYGITDPGNADRVITVGATHRDSPFTHGVSYFSSRGPTGDGRLKPDLVAPGHQITAPLPGEKWGRLDGTSQAAPHVSGAAAMLMARYPELIGNPDRIKRILCATATDLGRERNFQGHGLLDVLRALQSQ